MIFDTWFQNWRLEMMDDPAVFRPYLVSQDIRERVAELESALTKIYVINKDNDFSNVPADRYNAVMLDTIKTIAEVALYGKSGQ